MNKENYDKIGYAKYNNFLSNEYIELLNDTIDKLLVNIIVDENVFDENNTGKIKQIQYLHKRDEIFNGLIDKIKPIIYELLGHENYSILNMQLFEKHPYISKPTRAHQDNAYFKQSPPTPLTIWIALDDIDEENGCVYYSEYSHLEPTKKHSRYNNNTTFRTRSGVPGLSLCLHEHEEKNDIPIIVEKGDILVHNCNTIHRAGKNISNRRRRAIGTNHSK